MSIENTLERIAVALESLVELASKGAPTPAPAKPAKPAKEEAEEKAPPKKAPPKKPPAKEAKSDSKGPSLADVRKALTALQKAANSGDAPRGILSDVGGVSTLAKLDEDKYQDVIDAAEAAAEELSGD